MPGCEPCQPNRQNVLSEAQADVRERLWRRRDGSPRRGFAPVGDEGDSSPEQGSKQLVLRGKLTRGPVCQQSSDRDSNKRVKRVPHQIKGRNLVGEELNSK